MRIVIDMQGAQTESRFRGIGRYTIGFAQGVVRNRGGHEVILALSGLFPDTIEPIRAAFDGLLPQEDIRVWHAPGPVKEEHPGNESRREVAELVREAFLARLRPDVIHVSSLFEGYVDDAVTSIGRFDKTTPVSVTLHDLIPLLNTDHYLKPNLRYEQHYLRKIDDLKQAKVYLAVSESSRQEGLANVGMPASRVINTSEAVEPQFRPLAVDDAAASQLEAKSGITRPFVLYTGGADERKNLPRLIQAYAALPSGLRETHQLVFAGRMPEGDVARLRQQARTAGLRAQALRFTGHISDDELVQLYNLCRLYVFPSWHEGFGLPALEAMACGAPVIGASTSSLPEVIGLDEALFDPLDVASIAARIQQALTDDAFRTRLIEHGLQQARRFSWDETARRAIAAWETHPPADQPDYLAQSTAESRLYTAITRLIPAARGDQLPQLAACLALNQQAGSERQLLLDVSELAQRDAATGVQRVVRSYLRGLLQSPPKGFRVEPVYATREEGYRYARRFTERFLGHQDAGVADDSIGWQRGDIFFGLDMQHHVQLAHEAFYRQLRREGVTVKFLVYDLLPIQLADLFRDSDAGELHARWLAMVSTTDGAISISKATANAFGEWVRKAAVTPAATFQNDWVHIGADIDSSQPSTGLAPDAEAVLQAIQTRTTFLCVATLEPRKGQQQILDAVEQLWNEGIDVNLVFVGQQGWKIEALAERIANHPQNGQRLFWLKGISDEYLERVYGTSTCLIAASINEGFGLPLIEAARHGIPIVARDIPVFREVAGDGAWYFGGTAPAELAQSLKDWLDLHRAGQHPDSRRIRWSTWQESTERLKAALVGRNYPRKQLLLDISELVQRDARTGIQRVVRNVLREWLANPPGGWRVEPVYATVDQPYRYARQFTARFLGVSADGLTDESIDYAPGDVFFGLDLQPQVQTAKAGFYQRLRQQGVRVKFLVHDLLCIQQPEHFEPGAAEGFSAWLRAVGECDGAICVSKTTADELAGWMKGYGWKRLRQFSVDWNHNGGDVEHAAASLGLPANADQVLDTLKQRPSFLMVGTLEPRKGHAQVLDAFEQLWQEGSDVNLVIVGKQGWMVDKLVERLCAHPELDQRLFWLDGISDEYLERVYAASTCLIAASYGEGFGLPLIEAAQHKLPIIARDIPVFREVGGEHALYFVGNAPEALAQAVNNWL
ncbi:MAG: glycosyltransferase family 4 protein, partial [Methylococcaceae bacterium]|nr:glycosyltransferase family 4 protein [Methylococcaceae bacterium]